MTDLHINYTHYVMLCIFWAIYATRMQIILYGKSWWKVPMAFIVNLLFCPFCIIIATVNADRSGK